MAEWTQGYVSDIPYTFGFYREMVPTLQRVALINRGFTAPETEAPFNYCELGSGNGLTLNILAAAHPQAQFYGTDFNPLHIANAQQLAGAAGLENAHYFDESFLEFVERDDLPPFDFIGLHGIYSWISPENRNAIIRFIKKNLRVGGVVYVSYNVMPGWSAMHPLRYLMMRATEGYSETESSLARLDKALGLVDRLKAANALYFAANPQAKARFEKLTDQPRNYLAHEYFNGYWNPLYHTEAMAELSEAKLSFAASGSLLEHIDLINLSEEGRKLLAEVTEPNLRETIRDFLLNQQFRRDLLTRGAPLFVGPRREPALKSQRFVLTVAPDSIDMKQRFPVGEVTLQEQIYRPVIARLGEGPQSIADLMEHPDTKEQSLGALWQACLVLTGLNKAEACLPEAGMAERQESCRRFNAAVFRESRLSDSLRFVASPLTGSAVPLSQLHLFFLLGEIEGKEGPACAWEILSSRNQKLVKDGQTLETAEDNLAFLRDEHGRFTETVRPTLERLQIV